MHFQFNNMRNPGFHDSAKMDFLASEMKKKWVKER